MKLQSAVLAQAFQRGEWSRIAELRPMLRKISAGEPARCAEWIALACAALGRASDAAALFTALAKAEPENSSHCINLASSLLAQNKAREARGILENGLRRWPHQADMRANYGIACFAVERFEEAASELVPLAGRQPVDDDVIRLYAARALQEIGRPDEAKPLLEGWQPQWQSFALAELYQYAKIWIVAGRFAIAEQVLSQLLKAHPAEFTAALNLAALYERNNRLDDARALLAPLPPAVRASPLYLLTQAKLLVRAGQNAEALALFDAALAAPADKLEGLVPARFHSEIQFERGRILDVLGRYDDAFVAFTNANALIRDHHRRYNPATGDGMRVSWLADAPGLDRDVERARARGPRESPIFLVGFPRSGTTLMDQMLDAHPGLQVLEEKPALEAVVKSVANMPRGYPAALAGCDDSTLDNLRSIYWQAVDREITRKPGTRLVDKYPFNLVRIHLGMMLFPDAKWIFAIRHPCDVVLSCFRQNFGFTDTTHGFWNIGQTTSIYRQVMDLWLEQRARLRPDCFDLRYEDLVDDLEGKARELVGFLGLEWSDAVLAYHRHAQSRRIATPSYSQVVQPIYRSAMGRWRRYEKHFGAALQQLEPLIRQLGYGEDLKESPPAPG